ncbi:MAG: protein-disulfide reductase DsbD family protein, partial [Verrucomicrobiales bacterium]|nr:protein-disulfide reductase DsbD family protein [Verrucomicrobiales bacterium]
MRLLLALLLLTSAASAQDPFGFGNAAGAQHTSVELISENPAVTPGSTFTVGLSISHEDQWHTYYKHAGIGLPWKLTWDLPEGFTAGEIQFATPEVIDSFGLISYGYSGDITLLVDITAPDSITPGQKITLRTKADWQQCKESCETKSKDLSITLDVVAEIISDPFSASATADKFAAARNQTALPSSQWEITAAVEEAVTLTITGPADAPTIAGGDLYFFASSAGQIDDVKTHTLAAGTVPGSYTLTIPRPEDPETLKQLSGIVANRNGWHPKGQAAIPVSITVGSAAPAVADAGAVEEEAEVGDGEDPFAITGDAQTKIDEIRSWGVVGLDGEIAKERGLFAMVMFALLGGIILNVMPCVFPVLGIKIMGFVSQAGSSKAHIRMHGLVYAAGVIVSLWALVAVLLAVKTALGTNVNWGFQLQNPVFLAFLIALMFIFALSLSGVFELGTSLTSVGGGLQTKSGYSGSFFTGLLTVLVATPCTGPFMAPAISFALSGSALDTYLVFTGLAVGVALPYVVLSFFPALVDKLPRPGAWMETFKQFMAFPLYATVIWLITVFTKNVGQGGLTWLLAGLLTVAFGAWLYGRYATPVKKPATRWLARAAAAISLATLAWTVQQGIATKPAKVASNDSLERFG